MLLSGGMAGVGLVLLFVPFSEWKYEATTRVQLWSQHKKEVLRLERQLWALENGVVPANVRDEVLSLQQQSVELIAKEAEAGEETDEELLV